MWKRETIEEKERYAEMAQRERERHAKEYPDYKFLPRKKKDKNGKSPRRRKTYDPVLEEDESKILRMMLSQITHKKSQSEVGLRAEGGCYDWQEEISLKKTIFEANTQPRHMGGFAEQVQLIPSTYEYVNTVPVGSFAAKDHIDHIDHIDGAEMYGALGTCASTLENLNNSDFQTLMNTYGTNSANESFLGNIFDKSSTGFPRNITVSDNVKSADLVEKNEGQNIALLPSFDSTVLQDDIGSVQDNFFGLWDGAMDLSSFSTSNTMGAQEVLSRPFDPMNLGLVSMIKESLSRKNT
ncbi:uncharacterized protein T551_02014 [Pneumocystis jirovecii RU7]|uniref:HMG box domain-containing protein n=2 Tax=Pneumocystis jirovecii TaxID=42068 RepID=A0A0W4ZNZ3_PNEJ7|nr:uncharacterized protein T551_02014 [Pneumocystis jirovecii RU7]KTW30070.1 hypothetical protein T551_02014 [Pneumocystis jirovecii RU7]